MRWRKADEAPADMTRLLYARIIEGRLEWGCERIPHHERAALARREISEGVPARADALHAVRRIAERRAMSQPSPETLEREECRV